MTVTTSIRQLLPSMVGERCICNRNSRPSVRNKISQRAKWSHTPLYSTNISSAIPHARTQLMQVILRSALLPSSNSICKGKTCAITRSVFIQTSKSLLWEASFRVKDENVTRAFHWDGEQNSYFSGSGYIKNKKKVKTTLVYAQCECT